MTIEMKKIQHYLVALMLLGGLITMSSCNDDEDDMNVGPEGTGELVTFPLDGVANSAAGGMITFELMDDASTKITVELEGAVNGQMHPIHIHENTAAEGGGIVITLENVDGTTGKSETFVTMTDDESPISFEQLVDFDGYINVHQSMSTNDDIRRRMSDERRRTKDGARRRACMYVDLITSMSIDVHAIMST